MSERAYRVIIDLPKSKMGPPTLEAASKFLEGTGVKLDPSDEPHVPSFDETIYIVNGEATREQMAAGRQRGARFSVSGMIEEA